MNGKNGMVNGKIMVNGNNGKSCSWQDIGRKKEKKDKEKTTFPI